MFCVAPIQRICKYPLLLRELVKNVEESDPNYSILNQAYEKITLVVLVINDNKKKIENMRAAAELSDNIDSLPTDLTLIQPGRELVGEINDVQIKMNDKLLGSY